MAPERKSFVLFFIFVFAFSFFYLAKGSTSLYKKQSACNVSYNKVYSKGKHTQKNRTALLTFEVKKDNHAKRSSRSGFCEKTSKSIFDDIIVRNVDTTIHFKFFELRLHHFEYKKDAVYNKLFSYIDSNCDLYIHTTDYYIYTLRKIIT